MKLFFLKIWTALVWAFTSTPLTNKLLTVFNKCKDGDQVGVEMQGTELVTISVNGKPVLACSPDDIIKETDKIGSIFAALRHTLLVGQHVKQHQEQAAQFKAMFEGLGDKGAALKQMLDMAAQTDRIRRPVRRGIDEDIF